MKKVLGIVRNKWSGNEKGYFFSALDFYDEVLYIDPRDVIYVFKRAGVVPEIIYNGMSLNNLSMLYTFGYHKKTLSLAKSIGLCGCPVSDSYETISRYGIGKINDVNNSFISKSGTDCYLFGSRQSAESFFANNNKDEIFPLVTKPQFGNKGRGIQKVLNWEELDLYIKTHFKKSNDFIILEKFMDYRKEWRVYLLDGDIVYSYEKIKPAGSFIANLHQNGRPEKTTDQDQREIYDYLSTRLPEEYTLGVYGVDIARTEDGALHIIEINRTPGWRGIELTSELDFPRLVHKTLLKRARTLPRDDRHNQTRQILFVGDTSFGESYHERLADKGRENILSTRGYDHSMRCFKEILSQSDLVVANLETPLTNLAESALAGRKEYLHKGDIEKTTSTLYSHNIKVVSLANNHAIDYGQGGLHQTLEKLKGKGIRYIGAGLDRAEASQEYVHELNLQGPKSKVVIAAGFEHRQYYREVFKYYAEKSSGGVNRWSGANVRRQFQHLRQKHGDALIVAYPHWGFNYEESTDKQKKLACTMIESGADLVLGHGSHMMQGIENYQGRWVIYSLGNFVFNSPGRFQKLGIDPFSLIAELSFSERNRQISTSLRLYPIFTDNRRSDYQSYFVTEKQFEKVIELLLVKSPKRHKLIGHIKAGKDHKGYYISLKIN